MSKIENGRIYEYIENLYDDMKAKDGKYYPSKHDKLVFASAAKEFNITEGQAEKTYNSFSQLVAKKLELRLSRLPKKERQKRREEIFANILKNNGDLPFGDIEGPATEDIKSGLDTIYEEYSNVAILIGKNGWTIPMSMGLSKLDSLIGKKVDIEVLDSFFKKYYDPRKFATLTKHVKRSNLSNTQKKLFFECVDTFNEGRFSISATALITILEGVLSKFGDSENDIMMIRICRYHMDETKNDKKIINHLVWVSFLNFISELYKKSEFDKDEPDKLNRHWILHGRTDKELGDADCLRLFNAIYSLITMMKYAKK
ncbi:hypothetical protein Dred_3020 [Desulforamulus reducens MI-1]|uniref:Uncharacterized protein n=1 Tax=Desulforamulus reducens (strain ATCC BAA-1160 / DSM 100696 / MI-1) TaxID=349161 RepID=A4J8X0_DESRM|nr:hypothetical protein [Desulforamulus reducens]ABO51523.1 hypothetical protein Dred_3020 [Desulforamulus reducens MI-1]